MTNHSRLPLTACLLLLTSYGCSRPPESSQPTKTNGTDDATAVEFKPGPNDGLPGKVITAEDLNIIESRLRIKLPVSYRTLMQSRGKELRSYSYPFEDRIRSHIGDLLFKFDPKHIVGQNEVWRESDLALAKDFPNWWDEYFLIGTNGGGDFYALKLDGNPTVWTLDHELGRIIRRAKTLELYVQEFVDSFADKSARYNKAHAFYSEYQNGKITREEYRKLRSEAIYPRKR